MQDRGEEGEGDGGGGDGHGDEGVTGDPIMEEEVAHDGSPQGVEGNEHDGLRGEVKERAGNRGGRVVRKK